MPGPEAGASCHPQGAARRPVRLGQSEAWPGYGDDILPLSIFPSIRVFSNESDLHIRWPKY